MFTRCPTCHTTFAVTELQLSAKEGLVRCGHCTQVFNASWNLIDLPSGHTTDPAIAAAPVPPPPARESRRPSSDPDASPFDSRFSLLDDEADTPSTSEWSWTVPRDENKNENDNTLQPKQEPSLDEELNAAAMEGDEPISIMPPTLDELIATTPDEEIVLDASDLPGKTDNLQARAFLAAAPEPVEQSPVEKEKPDGLDAISSVIDVDELHISVDSSLGPENTSHTATATHDYRMPPRRRLRSQGKQTPKRGRRMVIWSVGSLLVTLLLAAQISYFYFYDLAQMAATRPYVTWVCRYLGCSLPPRQDVSLIDLVKTHIAYHPEQPQILRIQAELVNRADYFQRLPLVETSLTNRHGQTVARRTYSPAEYLPYTNTKSHDMTPGITITLSLTVARPDDSVVGYEIQLLPEATTNRLGPSQFNESNTLSRFTSTLSQLVRALLQRLADLVG